MQYQARKSFKVSTDGLKAPPRGARAQSPTAATGRYGRASEVRMRRQCERAQRTEFNLPTISQYQCTEDLRPMKNVLRLLFFAALVMVFALPSYAQDAAAAQTPAAAGPCGEAEAKAALYGKFRENFNKDANLQKVAYDAGKEYLGKYGACTDPADLTIIKYIQNWVNKYEEAT